MQKKFNSYTDAGHGWAKVPRSILEELGIAEMVSRCSYQRGDDVYLEEDADLTLFVRAFVGKHGFEPQFKNHNSDRSKIRGYESYEYMTADKKLELARLKTRMMQCRNWSKQGRNKIMNAGLQSMEYWQTVYNF